ncbi:MAG: tetratricopeptide repeat protein [Desulfobacteraceae bacterium]|nr:tetratricopeptide repeat protein [Desulfobacteraceae bacterium]
MKKSKTIEQWFEYGRKCFHLPNGVEAIRGFEKVIRLNPAYRHHDGDNPYFYLGKIAEIECRLTAAFVYYSRALAIDPADEQSLIGRGSCATVIGEHEQAIEDFFRLLKLSPKKRNVPDKHILYVLAKNFSRLKKWSQAIYWAQQAVYADPGDERHQKLFEKIVASKIFNDN